MHLISNPIQELLISMISREMRLGSHIIPKPPDTPIVGTPVQSYFPKFFPKDSPARKSSLVS